MAVISGTTTLSGAATQARVTLLNTITGAVVSSQLSDAGTGAFSFTGLAAGVYEILIIKAGYKARCDGPWVIDADVRVTDSGDHRITDSGDRRITE